MNLMITEVQITCIVLMGLITLFLASFLPRYVSAGKVYERARNLLTFGTALVMLHFVVQYILHKSIQHIEETRTVVNLVFGIPISYFVNLSYLYLERQGRIRKREWIFGPLAFIGALTASIFVLQSPTTGSTAMSTPTLIMAVIYAATLLYYNFQQIREFRRMLQKIKKDPTTSLILLVKWTQWSMLTLILLAVGFPLMTFIPNLLLRSFYGILAISTCFFYILCFIGYGFSCAVNGVSIMHIHDKEALDQAEEIDEKEPVSNLKLDRMPAIVEAFVESGFYRKSGITLKDVANQMGVSQNALKIWIRTTEHEKFSTWMVHLRIEYAKTLLLEHPDWTSEEIATHCGFCDRQYFQRIFRREEGISPSKWLKEQNGTDFTNKQQEA